jgi:TIGR03009 family protein
MRVSLVALVVGLALGSTLMAQTTPPAPSDTTDARLDGYLRRWEEKMRGVQTLQALLERTDKDPSFGSVTKLTGYALYMRVGTGANTVNLALLEMRQPGKTNEFVEKIVCTGNYLYQFLPAQKEVRAYEIQKRDGAAENGLLGFLFGMTAQKARQDFHLTLAKEDQYYIYVDVVPRSATAKADFTRARLVLNKDSFLPRQLWFVAPNKNETLWDLPRVQSDIALDRRLFDTPRTPPGWKFQVVPHKPVGNGAAVPENGTVPPRVVRPGSGTP